MNAEEKLKKIERIVKVAYEEVMAVLQDESAGKSTVLMKDEVERVIERTRSRGLEGHAC